MPSQLEDEILDVLKQIRAAVKKLPGKQRSQLEGLFKQLADLYGKLYKQSPGTEWPEIFRWPP